MRYVGMTQITEEQAELMTTEYQKLNEKTKEIMMEIQKDKVLDAVNQLEIKLDDLSQQCCLASYEVEDTLHDLQVCIDQRLRAVRWRCYEKKCDFVTQKKNKPRRDSPYRNNTKRC